ncbi:MAG: PEP-CTERM/exosortase system-associated acyltransferase [Thiobacillaceae bacterium]
MAIDLNAAFNEYFELLHADNDALREEVFRLRYQVYVVETGFERAVDFPDGLERDAYDSRSDHHLLRHRRTGLYAATARMILPVPEAPDRPYPMEQHCSIYTGAGVTDPQRRLRLGEVSRFAVSKSFKRRLGESGTLAGVTERADIHFEEDERRILPHISLGLLAVELRSMHNHGLTHCYAAMEPALHRLISRFGLIFHQIGPVVDYHGQRIPCLGDVHEFLPNIKRVAPPVWDLMTDGGRYTCGTE